MKYDFDTTVDRRLQGSYKWDTMAKAMGKDAPKTLALSTADMDFVPAPEIVTALQETAAQPIYGYTGPTEEYFDAVISWMKRRHQWTVEKESIALSPGIVAALYYVLHAFTQPGDGVIIQTPVYYPFAGSVKATNRKLLVNPLLHEDACYNIDFDDLERKAALPEAKVMFLCSPHNPVGRVWSCEELERIAQICTKNDVLLVSDEIHFDIVFSPYKHTVYANLPDSLTKNSIVCTSPSKTFNLSGMQISNIVIPDKTIRKQFVEASSRCGFHALNSFAYAATVAAYNQAEPWFEAMLDYVHGNEKLIRDYLLKRFPRLTVSPLQGTYLQWIDFSGLGMNYLEREKLLREQAGLFFESGRVFGENGKDFERFNIAYPRSVITNVLQRLDSVLR